MTTDPSATPDRPSAAPPVTVVIITKDRVDELLGTLPKLLSLPDRPPVLVVDNGSTDGTASGVAAAHPEVEVVRLDANLGAAGRNVGVRHAATPYVAFADDDSSWEPGALVRAAAVLDRHPRLGLLAARMLVGDEAALDPTCAAMRDSPLPADATVPGTPVLGFIACGAVVRREAFLEVGGFQRRYGVGGEEAQLAVDLTTAGWGVAYVDEVAARHWPSPARDRDARRVVVTRNDLWFTWARRRWPAVASKTLAALRDATRDRAVRAGVVEAVRHGAWVLGERRPVSPDLERRLRLLD